jgi:nucleoside-diphosphate-sugar epimerase
MILVTGGTGLLGAHLLFELSAGEEKIRALKRPTSSLQSVKEIFSFYDSENADVRFSKIEWVDGTLDDVFALEDALMGVDKVYHCAALVSFDARDRDALMKINAEGTANLVNACLDAEVKKLCHVSSTAAIGRTKENAIITEKTVWKNAPENTWYAISKYNAEREVWRGIEEGLPAVIVNPCVILGPADWNTGSSAMFRNAYKGMKFYTEGANAVVDVRDVVQCMKTLMESNIEAERYLIIGENISFRNLFDKIALAFGKKPARYKAGKLLSGFAWRLERIRTFIFGGKALLTKETARAAHRTHVYDAGKIKKQLGIDFRTADEAIKNAVRFFKKQ